MDTETTPVTTMVMMDTETTPVMTMVMMDTETTPVMTMVMMDMETIAIMIKILVSMMSPTNSTHFTLQCTTSIAVRMESLLLRTMLNLQQPPKSGLNIWP